MKERILVKRRYLIEERYQAETKMESLYFAAQLLNKFGVLVDQPSKVTRKHVELISNFYGVNIPRGFYSNPQDTRYYTCHELLVEQVVSYWQIAINGVNHPDSRVFDRVDVFGKLLPDYAEGKEVVFREYTIVDAFTAANLLTEVAANLASYTRKWSEAEAKEFEYLYREDFYNGEEIKGKDNAIEMFNKYPVAEFARSFDRKDIVKLSVEMVGESSNIAYTKDQRNRLFIAVKNCKWSPLTKKQAKYFNTIAKKVGARLPKANNSDSPHKKVKALMDAGRVVEAARVYSKYGSMLSRNLVWLLSRASFREAVEIVDMVKVTNPLVTMQFLQSLLDQTQGPRAFAFYKNRQVVRHMETDYETKYRKSVLSQGMKDTLKAELLRKIDDFYVELGGLGKVYIDDAFRKIAVPFNTSADGDGLDNVPTGTRQPITEDYLRTFCYWKNLFDVDSSIIFVHKDGSTAELSWRNYSSKPLGNSALSSGDDRSANGAEYQDFRLSELEAKGFEYGVYQLNGYGGMFNKGETYCGYQNKKDLNTKAWSAKNMALKIKLPKADSREYVGFVIDIKNREVIIINQMQKGRNRVVSANIVEYLKKYMNSEYVKQFNIYKIASLRGQVVDTPEEADVVFSDDYTPAEGQKVIRTFDTEKLVALML